MAKALDLGAPKNRAAKKPEAKQSSNTTKKEAAALVDLNFKVNAEFKREFKMWAASHDLKQKEVLEKAFQLLKEQGV